MLTINLLEDRQLLYCNNCSVVIWSGSLYQDGSWHPCWLDQENNKCRITGYQQEGILKIYDTKICE